MIFIKPIDYEIVFELDLKRFKFHGKEKVQLEIKQSTNEIVLNVSELNIRDCCLVHNGEILKPIIIVDNKKESLLLRLPKKISRKAELLIDFEGNLKDNLVGFYRSKYEVDGKEKYLITTQFEATEARRAFPCWDHPLYKASFNISLIIDQNLTAISNMPIIKEEPIAENKKLVKFSETPVMSTYLLYIGVGEFEFLEDKVDDVIIRIATTPNKKSQGKLALEYTKKFLKFYQDYFKIKYPLPKLDLVALPDFAAGAMENWGAITFRENVLLFNKKISSVATRQRIAGVISHELAHQWFGNLVTMKWWNDLWLNESFATFIGDKMMMKCYPEFDMDNQFLDEETSVALKLDSLKTSHKIEVKVEKPSEISEIFDEISYSKGGSILRMLENYLGEEIFRKGMVEFLSTHKYGNATTDNLWESLSKVSKQHIKRIMDSWIRQVGYPLVEIRGKNSKLELVQRRFLMEKLKRSDKTKWFIPLSIETDSNIFSRMMKSKYLEVNIGKDTKWFKINVGQNGFYRVKYTKSVLEKLKELIYDKRICNKDRWGIQNDLFALLVSGEIALKDYIDFLDCYRNEDDYLVSKNILDNLYFIYLISSNEDFLQEIKEFNKRFYRKYFDRLGWNPKKGERHTDALLRSNVIMYLGMFGDSNILKSAKERFKEFLKNPDSLHPDLRAVTYGLVAWQGNNNTHTLLTDLYLKAKDHEEKRRFLAALAYFQDKDILRKTLDFSITKEVRTQDIFLPIVIATANPYGRDDVWYWIRKNWKMLIDRHGGGFGHRLMNRVIGGLGILSSVKLEKDIKNFFERNHITGMEMTLGQTLEDIRINSGFLEKMKQEFSVA